MSATDYIQQYSWSRFTPVDSTGTQRSLFKSGYKNMRFVLELQELRTLSESDASNLPGLSFEYYSTVDFWRILLAFNGLVDPIQDVYAGQAFRIPTRTSILRWLSQHEGTNQKEVIRI